MATTERPGDAPENCSRRSTLRNGGAIRRSPSSWASATPTNVTDSPRPAPRPAARSPASQLNRVPATPTTPTNFADSPGTRSTFPRLTIQQGIGHAYKLWVRPRPVLACAFRVPLPPSLRAPPLCIFALLSSGNPPSRIVEFRKFRNILQLRAGRVAGPGDYFVPLCTHGG
jgi:hypothetical protein